MQRASSVRTPTIIRSGFKKTSKALPKRRFSGEQAKWIRLVAIVSRTNNSSLRIEPTGN